MRAPQCGGYGLAAGRKLGGVLAAIQEDGIIGSGAVGSGIRVNRDEEIDVVGIHFLADFGQVSTVVPGSAVVGDVVVRVWTHVPVRHHDVVLVKPHLNQCFAHLDTLPQVGVALIEATGVGSAGGCVGIRYGGQWTVVRTPTAMSGVDINSGLVVVGRGNCSCDKECAGYEK